MSLALANNQPGLSLWDTLPRNNSYDTSDMIEIGYIWKHIGIRGEVAIRIRTSFQDMRVGLAGPRYDRPSVLLSHNSHERTLWIAADILQCMAATSAVQNG